MLAYKAIHTLILGSQFIHQFAAGNINAYTYDLRKALL